MTMMKTKFRVLAAFAVPIFLVIAATAQQERPAVNPQPDTVYVSADGKFETSPDTAIIQFNLAAQEATSADAYAKASAAAERMRKVLRDNGIDPKSAELSFYSLQPAYDYRSGKAKITGYRVTSNVTLKLKDFAKVGPLVDGLSNIEETANQSLSYTLEGIETAKQKAIGDAFQKAKASALTVARAGGRTLGELSYASVDTFEQIQPIHMMRQASVMAGAAQAPPSAPTADFSPQKSTVTAHVNAVFMLK